MIPPGPDDAPSADLEASVRLVAEPWRESPYYEQAEQMLHVFWDEQRSPFLPLFRRLDLTRVLELACGRGRHAEQIVDRAAELILMDVHESNIAACRARLGGHEHVRFFVNNGYDFRPVEDEAVTSIFCYDAMVHFAPDLVASYLRDTARVLRPGGLAFYHHSNYAAPDDRHYGLNPQARNHMTQALFGDLAASAGLEVVESRVLDWGGVPAIDCLTLVRRPAHAREERAGHG